MICEQCGAQCFPQGGCWMCPSCGWCACDNRKLVVLEGSQVVMFLFNNN